MLKATSGLWRMRPVVPAEFTASSGPSLRRARSERPEAPAHQSAQTTASRQVALALWWVPADIRCVVVQPIPWKFVATGRAGVLGRLCLPGRLGQADGEPGRRVGGATGPRVFLPTRPGGPSSRRDSAHHSALESPESTLGVTLSPLDVHRRRMCSSGRLGSRRSGLRLHEVDANAVRTVQHRRLLALAELID
jgi:hypothetical protein